MAGRRHWHPRRCRICGQTDPNGQRVSQTGLCVIHGRQRMNENLEQLQALRGPFALWWAYKLTDALGAPMLDRAPPQP